MVIKKENYYCQGVYTPSKKYKGTLPCVYRSAPELKIMLWLDKHDSILEWSSESVIIPYIKPTDNKIHRYYIDFSCVFKDKTSGKIIKYLLEYKPFKQTLQPVKSGKKSDKTYLHEVVNYSINQSKWNSAKQYAENNGMKFIVITEKDIGLNH